MNSREEFIMNIGIILYSETGNTYSVSQKLKEKLVKAGHSVNMERLKVIGKVTRDKEIIIKDGNIKKTLENKGYEHFKNNIF